MDWREGIVVEGNTSDYEKLDATPFYNEAIVTSIPRNLYFHQNTLL